MKSTQIQAPLHLFWGIALGLTISRIGFHDANEIKKMFLLQDLRMLFAFMGGTGLILVYFFGIVNRFELPQKRKVTAPLAIGSLLFGIGWALAKACPAASLTQIGHGSYSGAITLASIFAGIGLFRFLNRKYFRIETQSCNI